MKNTYCPKALYRMETGKKPYTYCRELQGECRYMILDNCETRQRAIQHQQLKGLAKLLQEVLKR